MTKETNNQHLHYLDTEERELIESLDQAQWKSVDNLEKAKQEAQAIAEATLRKNRRMNVRIAERDLKRLKVRAAEEGIPYQTLVTMVLHKYVTGQLREKR